MSIKLLLITIFIYLIGCTPYEYTDEDCRDDIRCFEVTVGFDEESMSLVKEFISTGIDGPCPCE